MTRKQDRLIDEIAALKRARNAIILGHNYQPGIIQDISDVVGDSLGLSRQAAESDADVIVFCGVDFMAETAAILAPEKLVLFPDRRASCPMAKMATAEEVRGKKAEFPGSVVVGGLLPRSSPCDASGGGEGDASAPRRTSAYAPRMSFGCY